MAASAKTPPEYRKLTKMHRGLGLLSQLWLGRDHLLHVQSTGYTENYRRFYLRDIQAMLIVHTGRRLFIALALLVLALLTLMIVNSAGGSTTAYVVMAVIFVPLFAWNHLLGAGCRVVIVTAVQQENIPALSRIPKTRRVLGELQQLIAAAQGDLLSAAAVAAAPAAMPSSQGPLAPPPLPVS